MMAIYYAHRSASDQHQGLHYSHFASLSRTQVAENTSDRGSQRIKTEGESAKTG
jgi:hypothetical protein